METTSSRSGRPVASHSSVQHLELAPGGWRQCVEKIAEGYGELIGEHVYCLNCGGVLEGAQGHDIYCVTMIARRLLANAALLDARMEVERSAANLDGEHPSPAAKAARQTYKLYNRPHMRAKRMETIYVVPTFLNAAHRVRPL